MNLPVFVHVERKALVKSATNRAGVELPPFYKWDHVELQVTLLTDNPQATAAAPFLIIPTDGVDAIRAAIGNSLTGTARKVLAQQVTFLATPSTFLGTLSLATREAQDYLAFPEAWRPDASYTKGALVYHKNYTWEALKQTGPAPGGAEPGTDGTAWATYEIEREPLFFEIEVVQRGNVWKVLHEPCVVAQPVMEEPLVAPDLLEDVDALADALARRLPDTSTIRWTRNADRYDPSIKAAPDFDPLKGHFYGAVVWDAATGKYYQCLREQKLPVRAVVEANFDLHEQMRPPADGVSLQGGDRVLLIGQTDAGENGIYVVEPGGGWLEGRAVDATENAHFLPGFSVYVTDGANYGGTRWLHESPNPVDLDGAGHSRTPIVFTQGPGTGLLSPIELAYWGEARGNYAAPLYDPAHRYLVGDWVEYDDSAYQCIRNSLGHAPADPPSPGGFGEASRLYWGQLQPFGPNNSLFCNVKVVPDGGLLVDADGIGLKVDFTKGLPKWWHVESKPEMLGLAAKIVDYAVRDDTGDIYQLIGLPASEPGNWVKVYDPLEPQIPPPGAQVTNAMPVAETVGATGDVGTSGEAARADHRHAMPGLVTPSEDGFMSKEDKQLLDRLASTGSNTGGFDNTVRALLLADNRVYVGGDFTKYGSASAPRIAKLDLQGRMDALCNPGTGFDQAIHFLARASDGDLLCGTPTAKNTYQGTLGGLVWKLQPDGTPRTDFHCPDPIATQGPEELLALAAVTGRIVLLTPQTYRVTDNAGASQVTAPGTAEFHDLVALPGGTDVLVSSRAYSAPNVAQTFSGVGEPKALKRVDAAEAVNPQPLADWASKAGSGANASIRRAALWLGYDATWVFAGTCVPPSTEDGVDHSWNGGNAELFEGVYKLKADGTPATDFDVHITMAETGAAPIPFAVDSTGRVYLGGAVSQINGVAVTPWRLYRITKEGRFEKEFQLFNDRVLCCVLRDDNFLIAGGEFTQYGTAQVGRITFLDAQGNLIFGDMGGDEPNVGRIITSSTPPDVATNSKWQYWLWRKDDCDPPILHIWNKVRQLWQTTCEICSLQPPSNTLPMPVFTPASGTQVPQGQSLSVTITVPQHASATIYYTVNGEPNTASPSGIGSVTITVTSGDRVAAFATETGWNDSPVARATYGVLVPPESEHMQLINLNVGVPPEGPHKIGPGAFGLDQVNFDDVWNECYLGTAGSQIEAVDSEGMATGVKISVQPVKSDVPFSNWPNSRAWLANDAGDAMMKTAFGFDIIDGWDVWGELIEVYFDELPVGAYDLLVYMRGPQDAQMGKAAGWATMWGIQGHLLFGPEQITQTGPWKTRDWEEGRQYVRFDNLQVGPKTGPGPGTDIGLLYLKVGALSGGYDPPGQPPTGGVYRHTGFLNGAQLLRRKQAPQVLFYPWGLPGSAAMWGQQPIQLWSPGIGSDAAIYLTWTADNSEPPEPTTGSHLYTRPLLPEEDGLPVRIGETRVRIKAKAFKGGLADSLTSYAEFIRPMP